MESLGLFISEIKPCNKLIDLGGALVPVLIKSCPTWSESAKLDIKKAGDQGLIELYNHIRSAWDFFEQAKKANEPSDASTVIELEMELDSS